MMAMTEIPVNLKAAVRNGYARKIYNNKCIKIVLSNRTCQNLLLIQWVERSSPLVRTDLVFTLKVSSYFCTFSISTWENSTSK